MSEAIFVPYNEAKHRGHFYQMTLDYMNWINDSVYNRTGSNLFDNVQSYVETVFPKFTALKPPDGIIIILEVDGKPAGMGALRRLEGNVGEIKRMYVRPDCRGRGYGKLILFYLEDKAREFGFSTLRLDTGALNYPARGLYEKYGYSLRDRYRGSEASEEAGKLLSIIFMEKKL
jgi:GNAT superfamily N-acetyltransferase